MEFYKGLFLSVWECKDFFRNPHTLDALDYLRNALLLGNVDAGVSWDTVDSVVLVQVLVQGYLGAHLSVQGVAA